MTPLARNSVCAWLQVPASADEWLQGAARRAERARFLWNSSSQGRGQLWELNPPYRSEIRDAILGLVTRVGCDRVASMCATRFFRRQRHDVPAEVIRQRDLRRRPFFPGGFGGQPSLGLGAPRGARFHSPFRLSAEIVAAWFDGPADADEVGHWAGQC